jgi:pullulanase/glycogen debranching enzyme
MQKATKPQRMRPPEGPVSSVSSGKPAVGPDAHAARMPTSERPMRDYVAELSERADVRVGVPLPLKTYARGEGVNFAFFSRHANRVRLELFDHPEDAVPAIAFRCAHPVLSKEQFYSDAEILWLNPAGVLPDWFDPKEKRFACLIQENGQGALLLMFNAGTNGTNFGLPPLPPGFRWHLAVDPSRLAPQDLFAAGEEALVDNSKTYRLEAPPARYSWHGSRNRSREGVPYEPKESP